MLVDLVKILSTSVGTGAITLGQAVPGYRGTEALTNGETYAYSIQQEGTFEIGRGTLLGDQLVRSPLFSSTGGTAINLSPNAAVSFVALAEDLLPSALTIALRVPEGESLAPLPSAAARANLLVGFDADGNLVVTPGVAGPPGPATFPNLQSTNDTTDRTAALNAIPQAALTLSAGPYTFSSAPSVNNKTILGLGAQLAGPAYPYAADVGVLNAAGQWLTRGVNTGVATYTLASQLVALPSGSHNRSYESAAHLASLLVYDDSVYTNDGSADSTNPAVVTSARDYVAQDDNVLIPGGLGIKHARAWGSNSFVQLGSDPSHAGTVAGSVTASERRIDNYGQDGGAFFTATNINVTCVFAGGRFRATAGRFMARAGGPNSGFIAGDAIEGDACRDWVYSVWDIRNGPYNVRWGILPSGAEEMKASAPPAAPSTGRVRRYWNADGTMRLLFDDGSDEIIGGKGLSKRKGYAYLPDMPGYDPTGNTPSASAYQAFVNAAAAAGVPIVAPAGCILLESTVTLPFGHVFIGVQTASVFPDPTKSSTFLIGHSGKGFTNSGGSNLPGISITNQATMRQQPAVVSGQPWTPNDHDFDYYFSDISDLEMRNVFTINATRGIYMNGGRNKITGWKGHIFKIGLQIDWSYDTVQVSDVHMWPYWSLEQVVANFTEANRKSFLLNRVDNPFFDKIFSIAHQYAFYIDRWTNPNNSPNTPAGTTSKLKLAVSDLDEGNCGYYVASTAGGHTAKFTGVTAQGPRTPGTYPLLGVEAPNVVITGDFQGDNAGGNVIRLGASSGGSRIGLFVQSNSYNQSGSGFPAVESVSGGGHVDLYGGAGYITNGNGGAISSGDVTIWNP